MFQSKEKIKSFVNLQKNNQTLIITQIGSKQSFLSIGQLQEIVDREKLQLQ